MPRRSEKILLPFRIVLYITNCWNCRNWKTVILEIRKYIIPLSVRYLQYIWHCWSKERERKRERERERWEGKETEKKSTSEISEEKEEEEEEKTGEGEREVRFVFPFSHRFAPFSTNTTRQYTARIHPYDLQFINSGQKPGLDAVGSIANLRSRGFLSVPRPLPRALAPWLKWITLEGRG